MLFALVYFVLRQFFGLLSVSASSDVSKDIEILVLRHQLRLHQGVAPAACRSVAIRHPATNACRSGWSMCSWPRRGLPQRTSSVRPWATYPHARASRAANQAIGLEGYGGLRMAFRPTYWLRSWHRP